MSKEPLVVSNVEVIKNNLETDYTSDLNAFTGEKFKVFTPTHGQAVIIGSNFSRDQQLNNNQSMVLDATASRYIYDDGVRIGFKLATADGYGHSNNYATNQNIANTAKQACDIFITNKDSNTRENLKKNLLTMINSQVGRATSSLATTTITSQGNGSFKAIMSNTGDGMIIVLDGETKKLKWQLAATEDYSQMESAFSPYPVQALKEDNASYCFQKYANITEFDELNENDIIIHLTDGIWQNLPFAREEKDVKTGQYVDKVANFTLDKVKFNEIIDSINQDKVPFSSPNEIASALINYTSEVGKEKIKEIADKIIPFRKKIKVYLDKIEDQENDYYAASSILKEDKSIFKNLENLENLENINDNYLIQRINFFCNVFNILDEKQLYSQEYLENTQNFKDFTQRVLQKIEIMELEEENFFDHLLNMTIDVWLKSIKNENPEVARELDNWVERENINLKAKAYVLKLFFDKFEVLSTQCGDDATISVMQVPNDTVESVRAFLEKPESSELLIETVGKLSHLRDGERKKIFDKLGSEKILKNRNVDFKDNKSLLENNYKKVDLKIAEDIINRYIAISEKILSFRITKNLINGSKQNGNLFVTTWFLENLNPNKSQLDIKSTILLYNTITKNFKFTIQNRFEDDSFKNDSQWKVNWKIIRDNARVKLFAEVDKLTTVEEKLALLELAKNNPLFNQHRNHSFFQGAFGNTATVKLINQHIKQVERSRGSRPRS